MYGCMAVLAVLLYCPTVGAGQGESAVLPVYCQIRQKMLYEAVRWAALEMAAAEPDGQEARVAAVTNWLSIHGLASYAKAFEEEGFDDLPHLLRASEANVVD